MTEKPFSPPAPRDDRPLHERILEDVALHPGITAGELITIHRQVRYRIVAALNTLFIARKIERLDALPGKQSFEARYAIPDVARAMKESEARRRIAGVSKPRDAQTSTPVTADDVKPAMDAAPSKRTARPSRAKGAPHAPVAPVPVPAGAPFVDIEPRKAVPLTVPVDEASSRRFSEEIERVERDEVVLPAPDVPKTWSDVADAIDRFDESNVIDTTGPTLTAKQLRSAGVKAEDIVDDASPHGLPEPTTITGRLVAWIAKNPGHTAREIAEGAGVPNAGIVALLVHHNNRGGLPRVDRRYSRDGWRWYAEEVPAASTNKPTETVIAHDAADESPPAEPEAKAYIESTDEAGPSNPAAPVDPTDGAGPSEAGLTVSEAHLVDGPPVKVDLTPTVRLEGESNRALIYRDIALHPRALSGDIAKRTGVKTKNVTIILCDLRRRQSLTSEPVKGAPGKTHLWSAVEGAAPRGLNWAADRDRVAPLPDAVVRPARRKGRRLPVEGPPTHNSRVLAYLETHPGALSSEIADATGLGWENVSRALSRLAGLGKVRRVRVGGSNIKSTLSRWYAVSTHPAPTAAPPTPTETLATLDDKPPLPPLSASSAFDAALDHAIQTTFEAVRVGLAHAGPGWKDADKIADIAETFAKLLRVRAVVRKDSAG